MECVQEVQKENQEERIQRQDPSIIQQVLYLCIYAIFQNMFYKSQE
jgi:hypothetical protein